MVVFDIVFNSIAAIVDYFVTRIFLCSFTGTGYAAVLAIGIQLHRKLNKLP